MDFLQLVIRIGEDLYYNYKTKISVKLTIMKKDSFFILESYERIQFNISITQINYCLLTFIIQILICKSFALEGSKPPNGNQIQLDFKIPDNKNEWEKFKKDWKVKLGEKCFSDWPTNPQPKNVKEKFNSQSKGVSLRAIEFEGPKGPLSLYISHYPGLENPDLVVLTTLSKDGWTDFLASMRHGFEKELGTDELPEADLKSFKQHQGMYRSFKWAMAYFAPTGIHPDTISEDGKKGHASLDATRILELRYAIKVLRTAGAMQEVPLWLQGQGVMGGVSLYAGIYESKVTRYDLHNLIFTHRGKFLDNAFSFLDMPQIVTLALENSQVIIYQQDEQGWDYPASVSKKLSWNNKLQIRTLPPPKK